MDTVNGRIIVKKVYKKKEPILKIPKYYNLIISNNWKKYL